MSNETATPLNSGIPERPTTGQFCTQCGARIDVRDRFCPACGSDLAEQAAQRAATGATGSTVPADPKPGAEPVPLPGGVQPRRRRRRRWYKRPIVVIPVAILALLAVIGGVAAYRTMSAFDRVHSVSTPPPEISGAALGGDPDLVIDTGPAQEALREHEAAEQRAAESDEQAGDLATEAVGIPPTDPDDAAVAPTVSSGAAPVSTSGASGEQGGTEEQPSASDPTQGPPPPTVEGETSQLAQVPAADDADGESINILLMGVDAREGESIDVGVRPDSLGVLNLDEESGTCRILAVPRDSRVTVPGYGQSKVNHALAVGGIPFEQLVVEQYLGIEIDHYALVDFSGLVAVVDAVGGVTIDNPEAFEIDGHAFPAGTIELDGEEALAYARYRGGPDGDFGRVEKQQRILRALVDESSDANLVRLVPDMFNLLQDHFRTDFGVVSLLDLANTYRDRCTSGTLETRTIPGAVATMPDDMMDMNLSFVVSDPADVSAHVGWLLTGELGQASAAPVAPAPVATPAATPTTRRGWHQAQGW